MATRIAHPERFPGGLPQPPALSVEVWINPPKPPGRSQASSRTQPSDLPTRAASRSLPSIAVSRNACERQGEVHASGGKAREG